MSTLKLRDICRASYIRRVITAQEDERKRIARELHDSTSQSLTSLLVGLRHLEEANDPDTAKARLAEIRKTVNGTLDEVHALAWHLRPSVLDDISAWRRRSNATWATTRRAMAFKSISYSATSRNACPSKLRPRSTV